MEKWPRDSTSRYSLKRTHGCCLTGQRGIKSADGIHVVNQMTLKEIEDPGLSSAPFEVGKAGVGEEVRMMSCGQNSVFAGVEDGGDKGP